MKFDLIEYLSFEPRNIAVHLSSFKYVWFNSCLKSPLGILDMPSACCMFAGYKLPWEDETLEYSKTLAKPLNIALEASSGASDYGNKFGEPIIQGFVRSFGLVLPDGERREWLKPIMFTGGIGSISGLHVKKEAPEPGL